MSEEVSIDTLARMVRKVVREELEREDKRLVQVAMKLVLDSKGIGVETEPHEKRVITAGKG